MFSTPMISQTQNKKIDMGDFNIIQSTDIVKKIMHYVGLGSAKMVSVSSFFKRLLENDSKIQEMLRQQALLKLKNVVQLTHLAAPLTQYRIQKGSITASKIIMNIDSEQLNNFQEYKNFPHITNFRLSCIQLGLTFEETQGHGDGCGFVNHYLAIAHFFNEKDSILKKLKVLNEKRSKEEFEESSGELRRNLQICLEQEWFVAKNAKSLSNTELKVLTTEFLAQRPILFSSSACSLNQYALLSLMPSEKETEMQSKKFNVKR